MKEIDGIVTGLLKRNTARTPSPANSNQRAFVVCLLLPQKLTKKVYELHVWVVVAGPTTPQQQGGAATC